MSLDASRAGYTTKPYEFKYDWKTAVLYALGIGARAAELDYLYEGRGPKVYPTFAVVPAYQPLSELLAASGADPTQIVHGAQSVRWHRPIPPEGTLTTTGTIRGIYDMKRLAQIALQTTTTLAGEPLFATESSILVRDAGGFGGPRPPKVVPPSIPSGSAPAFIHSTTTLPEQAFLYRLCGDLNPLHADPEFAARTGFIQGPILHGLCTFGFVARAVILEACGGEAARLKSLTANFRKPVWPGEALRIQGHDLGEGRIAVQAFAGERPDPVITGCWAEISTS
jgi:acyl dehydratase